MERDVSERLTIDFKLRISCRHSEISWINSFIRTKIFRRMIIVDFIRTYSLRLFPWYRFDRVCHPWFRSHHQSIHQVQQYRIPTDEKRRFQSEILHLFTLHGNPSIISSSSLLNEKEIFLFSTNRSLHVRISAIVVILKQWQWTVGVLTIRNSIDRFLLRI